jgi:hypothetical protein
LRSATFRRLLSNLAAVWTSDHGKLPLATQIVQEWKLMIKERDGSQKAFETQAKNIISRSQGVLDIFSVSTEQF